MTEERARPAVIRPPVGAPTATEGSGMQISASAVLDEIRGMREDFREVSGTVAALAVEVKHLAEGLSDAKAHGERIRALEADVANLKARDESAATERRWIIGVLVAGAISMLGIVATIVSRVWR